MPKKHILEDKANQIKALLIKGLPSKDIAKELKVCNGTVKNIKDRCEKEIESAKKEVALQVFEKTKAEQVDKITEISKSFVNTIYKARRYFTTAKMRALNPVQLATTLAILTDKYKLLVGESTEIKEHRFSNREDMLRYLGAPESAKVPVTAQKQEVNIHITTEKETRTNCNINKKALVLEI